MTILVAGELKLVPPSLFVRQFIETPSCNPKDEGEGINRSSARKSPPAHRIPPYMATAADPTYPLYPVSCILSAMMLLLVLLTSFVRQSWNLGVAFLCFWVFLENLTSGVNAVVWSDNADVKLYVYCDIGQ